MNTYRLCTVCIYVCNQINLNFFCFNMFLWINVWHLYVKYVDKNNQLVSVLMVLRRCYQDCLHACVGSMWTCHCNEAAYEAEVGEVVRVDGRGRVDLQTIVALAGILEQTVHGVQHFMGQQEEPLSAKWQEERQRKRERTKSVGGEREGGRQELHMINCCLHFRRS